MIYVSEGSNYIFIFGKYPITHINQTFVLPLQIMDLPQPSTTNIKETMDSI